jgi:hypothetical protein
MPVGERAVNRVLGGGGESAQAQFFVVWCGVGVKHVVLTVDTEFHG